MIWSKLVIPPPKTVLKFGLKQEGTNSRDIFKRYKIPFDVMSYSITIWSSTPIDLNKIFDYIKGWKKVNYGYSFEVNNWNSDIEYSRECNILDKDIPALVTFAFFGPKIYCTPISIEPIQTPGSSLQDIKKIITLMSKEYEILAFGDDFCIESKEVCRRRYTRHREHVLKRTKIMLSIFIPLCGAMAYFSWSHTNSVQRIAVVFSLLLVAGILYQTFNRIIGPPPK